MFQHSRRVVVRTGLVGVAGLFVIGRTGHAQFIDAFPSDAHPSFIAEAERMRQQAIRAGDQAYGAVVVRGREIVGWGPSRVITDRNPNAHAERVAVWDAQARLGTTDLSGALLYSTSRACAACQAVAAAARVSRMYWGPKGIDAGVPRA